MRKGHTRHTKGSQLSLKEKAIKNFFIAVKEGKIKSGAVFSQSDLSTLLDASLSPLREALKQLEFQGLVEILPRSGVQIVNSDMRRIKDCFQLRRILEASAVRRYVEFERPTRLIALLDKHRSLLGRIEAREDEASLQKSLAMLDAELHQTLISALRNDIIEKVYKDNQDRILLFRTDSYELTYHSLTCTCQEHISLLEAAVNGDIEGAETAMDAHLMETMHRAMSI